jgi:hypothetical protein
MPVIKIYEPKKLKYHESYFSITKQYFYTRVMEHKSNEAHLLKDKA